MLIETRRCGRLFAVRRGATRGLPLVFWPSLLTSGGMWEGVARELEDRHPVVVIDPPGHGRSNPTTAPYSMDDSVEAGLAVLDALGLERCVWLGLSWGGMIGMRLALRAPERLVGLALFDTNARAESRRKLPSYFAMATIARRIGATPLILRRLPAIYLSEKTRREQPILVETFLEHVASMKPASVGHAVDAVIFTRKDLRPRLPEIRVPTLVVVGDDDVATPLDRSEEIARAIPGATLRRIADAGHLSAWERPDAALRHLEPWLDGLR